MLPRINGKEIIDCDLDDLQVILDNPSFAENEYLDYKKDFTIDSVPKNQKAQAQSEFRSDVCSFANTQGGYLMYGVDEVTGIPTQIIGISIKGNNRDAFEREIKNYLQPIKPRIPYYRIKFIEVSEDKFVVILFVQHDYFAPYIHLVDQSSYKIFKRIGNSKSYMEYQELRTMFTQSLSLEKEIERFRKERVNHYLSQEDDEKNTYSQFLLLHIIPDTFLDMNYDKPMFALQQKGAVFSVAFNSFECNSRPYPMAEGLRYMGRGINAECELFNNGVAEYFCSLRDKRFLCTQNDVDYIIPEPMWSSIIGSVQSYVKIINKVVGAKRIFACISLIGCKDAVTYSENLFDIVCKVDWQFLICTPVAFEEIDIDKLDDIESARLQLTYLTSLSINVDSRMNDLLSKVYGEIDATIQYTT